MSDVQAGTPTPTPDGSEAGTPVVQKDDSGLNAQQQKEYLTLKQKAEDYNKLEAALREKDAQLEELARRAYGGGQAATDPYVEDIAALQQQAEYDPVARVTLRSIQDNMDTKKELWLKDQLLAVPESKRSQVETMIRVSNFRIGAKYALDQMTDPETKTLAQQLADTKAELDRLKGHKPNGTSPGFVPPATASADDGKVPVTITRGEYQAVISAGAQNGASDEEKERARALMRAVGKNQTRFDG